MIVSEAGETSEETKPFRLLATDRANDRYRNFAEHRTITIPRRPILRKSDVVFTMGSCFAEEIRTALTSLGWQCVPRYRNIVFDPAEALVDTLPEREHMNFYNTFTVRQQVEQILGLWTQEPEDYWEIERLSPKVVSWQSDKNFQDPYLRLVVARRPDVLKKTVSAVQAEMKRGFDEANAFIFTFGMTEVFVNRRSGKIACQKPAYAGAGGTAETVRLDSTFEQNLENTRTIVRLVRQEKPHAPIFLSVSPVALERTFTAVDVVTASVEGKSILRAVLGQVSREFEDVIYVPSYEFVTLQGVAAYRPDFRHVLQPVVDDIMTAFVEAFAIT